jgi:hypothetical protein
VACPLLKEIAVPHTSKILVLIPICSGYYFGMRDLLVQAVVFGCKR